MKKALTLFILSLISVSLMAESQTKATFKVDFGHAINSYKVLGLFVLPDTPVPFEVCYNYDEAEVFAMAGSGRLTLAGPERWIWKSPKETGHYRIVFYKRGQDSMVFNCMVMEPFDQINKGEINDFQVGHYPDSDKPIYAKPQGLIEVIPSMMDVQLSPHFKVQDFLCKQECDFPMYLVLNEKLLIKLEMLLSEVREAGYLADKFTIMSGYRTPYYNESIGNVGFSRHQFGDAADIYIDQDGDNYMDDLNNDGRSNKADVDIFYNIVSKAVQKPEYKEYVGGLGYYKKNSFRTGFIHVDVRGYPARWGH